MGSDFFKQKTAYEMSASLVGSEMCIRDRPPRSSDALARGGIRYLHVSDDAVAFLRESRAERLLCLAARAPHDPIITPYAELETLYGEDARDGVLPADGPAFHVWRING